MLAVPSHPNLASFVTFDAGAKPKPGLASPGGEDKPSVRGALARALALS